MILILADAIDVPLVLGLGMMVLAPLVTFEVLVEAWVLRRRWDMPLAPLRVLALVANLWSLLSGIPVKILNAALYDVLLPKDIPGFLSSHLPAVALGSFIYFVVTVGVEGMVARRWLRKHELSLAPARLWSGILAANLATYAVLAPLHYYLTKPTTGLRSWNSRVEGTRHPQERILFLNPTNHFLQTVRLNGEAPQTIVPQPMREYVVSSNLDFCLYRGANNHLFFHRRGQAESRLIWETKEEYWMSQVAFSSSGQWVAYVDGAGDAVGVCDTVSGRRAVHSFAPPVGASWDLSLVWSMAEREFFLQGAPSNGVVRVSIQDDLSVRLTNWTQPVPELLAAFGRVPEETTVRSSDWYCAYTWEKRDGLWLRSEGGFTSRVMVYRENQRHASDLRLSVSMGLFHLAWIQFGDVAFLDGGHEFLCEASGFIYLVDIEGKKLGTVVAGERFVLLTDRYRKHL